MTHLLDREESTREPELSGHDELTEHERALLRAWDDSNAPGQDEAGFELRLVEVYAHFQAMPPATLDGEDARIRLQIAADADEECQREREAREREARRRAFLEVAPLHQAYLYATAIRLSGHRDIASDLVQETLVRALSHLDRFTPGTNARAWLTTILTRVFLDQRKHEKVVTRAEPELMARENVDHDMTLPRVSDAALLGAVEALETDLRHVIELRYFRQLSYKEIADRLHVAVGTVGTRLMRAHERLKALLQPQHAA